ncbi:hypothetical protein [uncultured Pelagimonas sp.]|uniref:hypothetical protein n=1 Tax=uncultured Pelagimonas sp. TaxID=1618102 RepID=UPI0026361973|nr:hypothetical protein [uncultured Pelagimonas sp.]
MASASTLGGTPHDRAIYRGVIHAATGKARSDAGGLFIQKTVALTLNTTVAINAITKTMVAKGAAVHILLKIEIRLERIMRPLCSEIHRHEAPFSSEVQVPVTLESIHILAVKCLQMAVLFENPFLVRPPGKWPRNKSFKTLSNFPVLKRFK